MACGKKNIDKITTDDVIYSGSFLPTLNVMPNSDLTDILNKIEIFASSVSGGGSNYTIKGGISNQTANGLTLSFNIPHTLGQIPDTYSVQAANTQTANNFSVTISLTNLTITYSVAPSQGASLSWVWQVIKL